MKILNIDFEAGAAAASKTVEVKLAPGSCAMISAVKHTGTCAAACQPKLFIQESSIGSVGSVFVSGPDIKAGQPAFYSYLLGVSTTNPPSVANAVALYVVNVSLPYYIIEHDFVLLVQLTGIAGAEVISAGRVQVYLGTKEELLGLS